MTLQYQISVPFGFPARIALTLKGPEIADGIQTRYPLIMEFLEEMKQYPALFDDFSVDLAFNIISEIASQLSDKIPLKERMHAIKQTLVDCSDSNEAISKLVDALDGSGKRMVEDFMAFADGTILDL